MSAQLESYASVRPMGEADLDRVATLESEIYPFPWSWRNFADSLNAGYSCWLYHYGEHVIGYVVVMVTGDEGHLLNLSVARDWQGHGWGRKLLLHVLDTARQYGVASLFLEVRPSNHIARRLYESAGFNEIGLRRAYYPAENGREDAIVMALQL